MNRKEMMVVGVIILLTFVSGAFATPALEQVFVTNFPSNQNVTVTNRNLNVTVTNPTASASLQTTAVDIDLNVGFNGPPATAPDHPIEIWNIPASQPSFLSFDTSFSFAPVKGFVNVTVVYLSIVGIVSGTLQSGNGVNVYINNCLASKGDPTLPYNDVLSTDSASLDFPQRPCSIPHPGSNTIRLSIDPSLIMKLYHAHLTIEYNYLAT